MGKQWENNGKTMAKQWQNNDILNDSLSCTQTLFCE